MESNERTFPNTMPRPFFIVLVMLVCMSPTAARCNDNDSFEDRLALYSSKLLGPMLVVGGISLLRDDEAPREKTLQGVKAVAAAAAISGAMQEVIPSRRPNGGTMNGFPSGHTAMAFAMAEVMSTHKPRFRPIAYGVAVSVGWSRVDVEAHHWQDVFAGAALGYLTAKHFTRQRLSLTPAGLGYTNRF
jgi:hypothetical protein